MDEHPDMAVVNVAAAMVIEQILDICKENDVNQEPILTLIRIKGISQDWCTWLIHE